MSDQYPPKNWLVNRAACVNPDYPEFYAWEAERTIASELGETENRERFSMLLTTIKMAMKGAVIWTRDESAMRTAWEAGFKLCQSYGDNSFHFQGAQRERQWDKFLASLRPETSPSDGAHGASTEIKIAPESAGQSDTPESDANMASWDRANEAGVSYEFARTLERRLNALP